MNVSQLKTIALSIFFTFKKLSLGVLKLLVFCKSVGLNGTCVQHCFLKNLDNGLNYLNNMKPRVNEQPMQIGVSFVYVHVLNIFPSKPS